MNTDKDRIYVSDIIDWKRDIEPYPITLLLSGCGSRKNGWIDSIVRGDDPDIPINKTLVITSRAAKRKETLNEHKEYCGRVDLDGNVRLDKFTYAIYQRYGFLPEEYEQYICEDGTLIQDACIIPIQIDSFLFDSAFADPEDLFCILDSLWQEFDLLVIDEIHSLLLDSGYMISQARIFELIKAFANRCKAANKHMILMTATEDGVKSILKAAISNLHIIDLMRKTYSVMPKSVRVTPAEHVKREQELLYINNIKFIYFYNGRAQYLSDYCNDTDFKEEDGVSLFSDIDKRNILRETNYEEYEKMIEVEAYLAEHKRLPDNIKFVLSTSKNREGISIDNEDFTYMYVDSHIPSEVIQYSGRLRNAEYTLTIVDGSYQYRPGDAESMRELYEIERQCLPSLNKKLLSTQDKDYQRYLIDKVENKEWITEGMVIDNPDYHPYIFFNPFAFRFEINELKVMNEKYIAECINKWDSLDRKKKTSFSSYIRDWFPKTVKIENYETKEWLSLEILRKNGIFPNSDKRGRNNSYYSDKKIESIKKELSSIWGKFDRINTYLRRFDNELLFQKVKSGKHKDKWELVRKPI